MSCCSACAKGKSNCEAKKNHNHTHEPDASAPRISLRPPMYTTVADESVIPEEELEIEVQESFGRVAWSPYSNNYNLPTGRGCHNAPIAPLLTTPVQYSPNIASSGTIFERPVRAISRAHEERDLQGNRLNPISLEQTYEGDTVYAADPVNGVEAEAEDSHSSIIPGAAEPNEPDLEYPRVVYPQEAQVVLLENFDMLGPAQRNPNIRRGGPVASGSTLPETIRYWGGGPVRGEGRISSWAGKNIGRADYKIGQWQKLEEAWRTAVANYSNLALGFTDGLRNDSAGFPTERSIPVIREMTQLAGQGFDTIPNVDSWTTEAYIMGRVRYQRFIAGLIQVMKEGPERARRHLSGNVTAYGQRNWWRWGNETSIPEKAIALGGRYREPYLAQAAPAQFISVEGETYELQEGDGFTDDGFVEGFVEGASPSVKFRNIGSFHTGTCAGGRYARRGALTRHYIAVSKPPDLSHIGWRCQFITAIEKLYYEAWKRFILQQPGVRASRTASALRTNVYEYMMAYPSYSNRSDGFVDDGFVDNPGPNIVKPNFTRFDIIAAPPGWGPANSPIWLSWYNPLTGQRDEGVFPTTGTAAEISFAAMSGGGLEQEDGTQDSTYTGPGVARTATNTLTAALDFLRMTPTAAVQRIPYQSVLTDGQTVETSEELPTFSAGELWSGRVGNDIPERLREGLGISGIHTPERSLGRLDVFMQGQTPGLLDATLLSPVEEDPIPPTLQDSAWTQSLLELSEGDRVYATKLGELQQTATAIINECLTGDTYNCQSAGGIPVIMGQLAGQIVLFADEPVRVAQVAYSMVGSTPEGALLQDQTVLAKVQDVLTTLNPIPGVTKVVEDVISWPINQVLGLVRSEPARVDTLVEEEAFTTLEDTGGGASEPTTQDIEDVGNGVGNKIDRVVSAGISTTAMAATVYLGLIAILFLTFGYIVYRILSPEGLKALSEMDINLMKAGL